MATRLGVYPFNADICITNTDISINNIGICMFCNYIYL